MTIKTRCWLCTAFTLLTVTELTNPTLLHGLYLSMYSANSLKSLQGVADKDDMAAAM